MWPSLKKLYWPEVTPIHHILKSNVRRKVNFPLLKKICANRSENVWLVLRPCKGIRIQESGKFLLVESKIRDNFAPVSGNQGFGIQNRAQVLRNATKAWNPQSTFHWKRLEFSTRNPQFTEWDPETKTVWYSLTWGDSIGLRTASYYNAERH